MGMGITAPQYPSGLRFLSSQTLVAAATSINFGSLSGSNYSEFYLIVHTKGVTNVATYSIEINNDSTAANYNTQRILASAAAISTVNAATNTIGGTALGASTDEATYWIHIGLTPDGYAQYDSTCINYNAGGANSYIYFYKGIKVTGTASPITQIKFVSSVASTLAIGTNATLFGVVNSSG